MDNLDKLFHLLKYLKNDCSLNQRELSKKSSYSLGMVNTLLKRMEDRNLIEIKKDNSKIYYTLTEKGNKFLDNLLRERSLEKVNIVNSSFKKIKTAVILAAGKNTAFSTPVGLLPIDEDNNIKIIDRIMDITKSNQIENIILITGYLHNEYENYFQNNKKIKVIFNDRFAWTGTMHSLFLAKDYLLDDFLIIEADHVFESSMLNDILNFHDRNCILLTPPSEADNDTFVEFDKLNNIEKISKDIHQFNRIDANMCGIHKISYELFNKMLEVYNTNENPFINYEYVLLDLLKIYNIKHLLLNDINWININNNKQYKKAKDVIYPRILNHEKLLNEELVIKTVCETLALEKEDIKEVKFAGGMTNSNYRCITKNKEYIVRIPGKCTEIMISRFNEKYNSKLGYLLDLNVDTIYFNDVTGIKITEYISNAETLTPQSAKLEENIKRTTSLLRKLHSSNAELQSTFDVFSELQKYEELVRNANGSFYPGYLEIRNHFFNFKDILNEIGMNIVSCHNDLVAENFIKNQQRMYLIDWEYAGMNDPMWDLAAHLLECAFEPDEEVLLLKHYFENKEINQKNLQKILIFKILQDFLWSVWTMAKESEGEDFGTYGIDRLHRAESLIKEYKEKYEN